MKPKLSIIVPGIRPDNWDRLYKSVNLPIQDWEMIFVGPWDNTAITSIKNVKFFKDFGSPTRAMNIGLVLSEGEWIHWSADDAWFINDEPANIFESTLNCDANTILSAQYLEGPAPVNMDQDSYYKIGSSIPYWQNCSNVNGDWFVLNTGIVRKNILEYFGGWDSQFETLFWTHTDLAIRLQKFGYKINLYRTPIIHCEHMPGKSGDHGPVDEGHNEHDEPLFRAIYTNPSSSNRFNIDINNWKSADSRWSRRFK